MAVRYWEVSLYKESFFLLIFSSPALARLTRSFGLKKVKRTISQHQSRFATSVPPSFNLPLLFMIGGVFDSVKKHKRQRRKRQSVTAKREKSQTPKFV